MTDQMRPQYGAFPWCPGEDARLVEVYHRYDVPLEGLVWQGGATYLFRCIFGAGHDVSVWAYVLATEREQKALEAAYGEDLDVLLDELFAVDHVVVALAEEDQGIVLTAVASGAPTHSGLVDSATQTLKQRANSLAGDVKRVTDDAELLRA